MPPSLQSHPGIDEFPLAREQLSADWVGRALARSGHPEAAPGAIRLEDVPEPGQTADVYVVHLEHDAPPASAPRSLLVKAAPLDERHRLAVHDLGLYARELSFYRDFLADPGIALPEVHFASIDPDTGHFLILMENLAERARQGDMWRTSLADVEAAIEALAGFHAHWWQHPRVLTSRWLAPNDAIGHFERDVSPMLPTFSGLLSRKFGPVYGDYLRHVVEHLGEGWARAWAQHPIDETTLLHGDFHPKELFFEPAPRGGSQHADAPGRVVPIDWQAVCRGAPGVDLHRILLAGLGPAELHSHQERLLDRYHALMREREIALDREALGADTRRAMLLAVRNWLFSVAFTDHELLEASAAAVGVDYRQRLFDDFARALEHNRVHELLG